MIIELNCHSVLNPVLGPLLTGQLCFRDYACIEINSKRLVLGE